MTNNTLQNIISDSSRKYDTIPYRLKFVNALLEGCKLNPLMYDNQDTEVFLNPLSSSDDEKTNSTKYLLKKKFKDLETVFNTFDGKLKYIKSGTTGHTFKGFILLENGKTVNYGVKVVAFPKREKYGNLYTVDRPENSELMMIRLLSYFVVKGQTPHIVLPIATFNTSIKYFVDSEAIGSDHRKYKEFIERYKKKEYYDKVSILISEWANKGDLLDYLRKNYQSLTPLFWKVIFFQFISVLAVIQSKYPSFRHNDLKANNVLIHKVIKKKSNYSYTVCNNRYNVPSVGYQVKIWDFDFACIPGIVDNRKVSSDWTAKINVRPIENKYYDMHYFFNTLIKKGFFPQFMTEDCIPQEAKDFVNSIIPKKYQKGEYVSEKGRILINNEYLTPNEVLKTNPYFEEFRVKNKVVKKKSKKTSKKTNKKTSKKSKQNIKSKEYKKKQFLPETSESS